MEINGIHTTGLRKEITCSDCGHLYLISVGQRSSACRACGNIEYFGASDQSVKAFTENIVAKRVLPRLKKADPDLLSPFRSAPDGQKVEAIRSRYQVEWQLWCVLVKNFQDPAYHSAFLTNAIATNRLEQASNLYREHRSVMVLLYDSRWQAEVADLMLERIEAIAVSRMPQYRGWYGFDLPAWMLVLPAHSKMVRVGWIAFGLFMVSKFLRLYP